jgi:deoxyribodipyrimidine photo-lyase
MSDRTAIWWIRRDLRLRDNQALQAALEHGAQVIPLFILDPRLWASDYVGPKRLTFLIDGLRHLDNALREKGSRLILRRGEPAAVLSAVIEETGATAIFSEEDISPFARKRDARVGKTLPLKLTSGLTVQPIGLIRKKNGQPYTVFTPFSKAWRGLAMPQGEDILEAPASIFTSVDIESLAIPSSPYEPVDDFPAGEGEALKRLKQFTAKGDTAIYEYETRRNVPAEGGTSKLSPYLRFGMVSARETAVAALKAIDRAPSAAEKKGADIWLNELIWREFFINILYHFPRVRQGNFNKKYDKIEWINDYDLLMAWQEGRTGYPIVDAAMRQLVQSGWMHNRTRMITASFLVKDLLIDWRLGEAWFMQHLLDGDPAANNGGWQWTAGTGTDAAPYFRIFNPVTQSKKFDPRGTYIKRWLPELSAVPVKYIHEPWLMPPEVQAQVRCTIDPPHPNGLQNSVGTSYPAPIVDHAQARKRTLAVYKSAPDP